jgi:hypothetical protein
MFRVQTLLLIIVVGLMCPPGHAAVTNLQITFAGATQYTFTQKPVPVPEPDPPGLLMGGLLLLGGWAMAKRRRDRGQMNL